MPSPPRTRIEEFEVRGSRFDVGGEEFEVRGSMFDVFADISDPYLKNSEADHFQPNPCS